MSENQNLLEIKDLSVQYVTVDGTVHAVENLNLTLKAGETLGLVGETGAGKTTTVKAVMGILPTPPAKVPNGEIIFDGRALNRLSAKEMRKIRGKQISMIFQDPMTSLNPVMTVGEQIEEAIRLHNRISRREAAKRACDMLETVGIKAERAGDYPHQFSGGMKQRVVIAMALACSPKLLIADEPTTALDVTIQQQILELMKSLQKKNNMSIVFITHNLGVVAEICDRVSVMYAGHIVEQGLVNDIFYNPQHPYTKGLLASMPRLDQSGHERLIPIEGTPVDLLDPPAGCSFGPRCKSCMKVCLNNKPPMMQVGEDGHVSACWLHVQEALAWKEAERT